MTPSREFTYIQEPTHELPQALSIWRDRQGNMYAVDQNNHLKRQTLILQRKPDGAVTTLAGSSYGFADGKGAEARFGSLWGMAIGPDDSLYVTDSTSIRRIQLDGTVTTIASGLDFKTVDDDPKWLGGLAGLSVDESGNVYVADTGRRRVLRVKTDGNVEVVSRAEPPYFPNGVFAISGELYVLEIGLTLPNASSGPRVRRITAEGKNEILATVGTRESGRVRAFLANQVGVSAERVLAFIYWNPGASFGILAISSGSLVILLAFWQRRRRATTRRTAS